MSIKNRNLFRLTRFILLKFPYLLQLLAKLRKPSKKILIIKTDAIGDYILFRNFLEEVKKTEQYQDYQIDLLGNSLWQNIALQYDKNIISHFYFVKAIDLYHRPLQVLNLGWKLFKQNYTIILQPSYTRNFINDGLAALTKAKQIIGFDGDFEAIAPKIKKKTDKFYTEKFILPTTIYFEFDRTKFFFERFLQRKIFIKKASLPVLLKKSNTIMIFPGAGYVKRNWEIEKFATTLELLLTHTSYKIILAGGRSEEAIGTYLTEKLISDRIENLINRTTLVQLTQLIASSTLVIANETSAVHIASACNVPSVCILGGGHFNRFAPYPNQPQPDCVYELLPCFNCNWNCKFETTKEAPYPCISIVSVEQVWSKITKEIKHF